MEAHFIVHGTPVAKARPRFAGRGNFVRAYTPKQTVNYENLVKLEYQNQCGDVFFDKETPLRMVIKAYLPIPKSASQKKAALMAKGAIRPLKKPDSSNICKSLEDGILGIAYVDDSQIVSSIIDRYYSDQPRAEVTIIDITEELENV